MKLRTVVFLWFALLVSACGGISDGSQEDDQPSGIDPTPVPQASPSPAIVPTPIIVPSPTTVPSPVVAPPAPENNPPVAHFSASQSDLTLTVNASLSSDSDGSIVSYIWNFDNEFSDFGVSQSFTFNSPGEKLITLIVMDDDGLTSEFSQTVNLVSDELTLLEYVTTNVIAGSINCITCHTPGGFAGSSGLVFDSLDEAEVERAVVEFVELDITENAQLLKGKPNNTIIHFGGNRFNGFDEQAVKWNQFVDEIVASIQRVTPTKLDSTGWVLSSSDNAADVYFAIDGDLGTRWTTDADQTPGQTFTIALNDQQSFDRIILGANQSENDYPRSYVVEVSDDGNTWIEVQSGEGTIGTTVIDFADQNASFIRIEQQGSSNRFWWSIHELAVFANASEQESYSF